MTSRPLLFLLCLLPFMACKKENTFKKYKPSYVDLTPNGYGYTGPWAYKALQLVMTQGSSVYYSKVYSNKNNEPNNYTIRMEDSISTLFQAGIITLAIYEQGKKIGEGKGELSFNNPYFYAAMDSFYVNVSLTEQQ